MLQSLRRRFRLIRYYSASREATIWSRGADWVLVGSFVLALPAVILCNASVVRTDIAQAQTGVLSRADQGDEVVAVLETADEPSPPWTPAVLGRFTLRIIEEQRGWPLVTSTRERPAEVEYDLYHEEKKRIDSGRGADAPMREGIAQALDRSGRADLIASWHATSPTSENTSPLRWLFASVIWWVLLYVAGALALLVARIGFAVHQRYVGKRAGALRRRGLCEHCGYDLRGTEFSERCPECGEYSM